MARLLPDRLFFQRCGWNPFAKVVCDPITGTILPEDTYHARKKRGLRVPWKPEMLQEERGQAPVY